MGTGRPVNEQPGQTDLDRLWQLQLLDAELSKLRQQLEGHPLRSQLEQGRRDLAELERRVGELERRMPELRLRVRQGELEVRSLQEQVTALEGRLFGGQASHPKELQSLQARLEQGRRRLGELEEQVLQAMLELDECQGDLQGYSQRRRELQEQVDRLAEQWSAVERELLQALGQLEQRHREVADRITHPGWLSRYHRLREAKDGRAVSPVDGERCGACGVPLPTLLLESLRRRDRLVACEICGRILYLMPSPHQARG